ncbi:hypothetical protein [Mangrovimonas xylaniphaga]|uniref:hypothetical protein n=1 Tax=Mangrovimonas xylaniphaga TaxID=1645915 RepID=UPI0006B62EC4|nr:hypothetical protein [Mangrovimonas xylaniphaga]
MKDNKLHLNKSAGHQVPEGYFDKVEDAIWDQANLSSKITTPGFEVPSNYFESFDAKILRKVQTQEFANPKITPFWTRQTTFYAAGIAATIILLLGLFLNSKDSLDFNDLETVSIESYLSEEEFTDQDLAALTTEDYLLFDGFNETNIPDATIENYLIEHSSLDDLEYISEP